MKGKISEIRAAGVLVFITIAVCMAGIFLYKNLTSISEDVSASYQKGTVSSDVVRHIIVEFRDAENCIKTYNLTHNNNYLLAFFKCTSAVEEKLDELEGTKKKEPREKVIVDSIIFLSEARFELLKRQLFLDDEKNITNELNAISKKIQETNKYVPPPKKIVVKDSPVEEEKTNFFSRLFGKKKKASADTLKKTGPTATVSDRAATKRQLDSIAKEINAIVLDVKEKQFTKIQNRQTLELQAESEGKRITDKIHLFYLELEKMEKQEAAKKIELARRKVNYTKQLGTVVSVIISMLLLIVSLFIVFYSRKKSEYEAALLRAKHEAEDLAKTKEMFLANMSHEIKTPLNAIYGFTDQVLQSNLSSTQKEHLTIVKKATRHLINLITDILNYSRIQSGRMPLEMSSFSLIGELRDMEVLFGSVAAKKNIKLIFETSENVPAVIKSDFTKIKQVLLNIIGNAIKFTEKGSVRIFVQAIQPHGNEQKFLSISIVDTGIGIPSDKIDRLFNEYEQAHEGASGKYGGTGLGLVITKKIVELLGGIIVLESVEHKGTEVTITIPYEESEESEVSENKDEKRADGKNLKAKKILIADDEVYNRLLLKTILDKYKVELYEVQDGLEAIELIKKTPLDLVIMDINMPVKNGMDACREIRKINGKEFDKLPVLASSAVQRDGSTGNLREAGFNGFILKPFTEHDLIEKIASVMDGREAGTGRGNSPKKKKLNFGNIESISNGDEAFKKEMISIFYKSINDGAPRIEVFCKEHKWHEVSDLAHKMMPPCKHFEAEDLYAVLGFFEDLRDQHPDESLITAKLHQLREEVKIANSELQIYL